MYVKRGSYTHDLNEATFRWRLVPQYTENNVLIGTKRMASITGRMSANDASALSTKVNALEAAYAATSGDFVLLQNDGTTETPWKITGSQTIGGIRCTRLEYPNQQPGGDWTTYLNYEIDIEADFGGVGLIGGGSASQAAILTWNETLSFRGTGGPRYVLRELRNGPPQKQIVSQSTPIYASQRGDAVGLYRYPTPSNPIWPQYEEAPSREIARTTADQVGGTGNQQSQRQYRISWSYSFQAPGPIQASPVIGF